LEEEYGADVIRSSWGFLGGSSLTQTGIQSGGSKSTGYGASTFSEKKVTKSN